MEDQPPILKLNEYCLKKIFSYFNIREVLILENVCETFKNIAESFYRVQLELKLFYSDFIKRCGKNEAKEIALRVGPYVETLKITCLLDDSILETMKYLLTLCTNLQHLEIENCKIMTLMEMMPLDKTFAGLKVLKLKDCDLTDEISPYLKVATHLRSLTLAGSNSMEGSFLTDMKYLEEIHLCGSVSKKNFLEFCKDNLTLKSLGINCIYDDDILQAILNGLKNLECIKIKTILSHERTYIGALSDLPKLVRLVLHSTGWTKVSPLLQAFFTCLESLEIIGEVAKDDIRSIAKFERLKELTLYEITDENLEFLTAQLRCKDVLENFEIPFALAGNDAVYQFVEKCPRLKNLDLTDCQNITKDLIIRLVPVLNERPQKITIHLDGISCVNSIHEQLNCLGNSKIKLVYQTRFDAE